MNKALMWILIAIGVIILLLGALVVVANMTMTVKKPAVYLYPKEDMDISVHLKINGKITLSEPMYDYTSGWYVHASTDGTIINENILYDYLFYEAKLDKVSLPEEGWIVKYEDLDVWFDEYLPKLGLNEKESMQFKEYWIKELPERNYYAIHLLDKKYLDENMGLIINPQPDTLIRVELYFKGMKNLKDIVEPKIDTPERRGFTVVEWGGMMS